MILLVRHAKAGARKAWRGPDRLRPLSQKGQEQAKRLAALLGPFPVTRVLSSPFVRCVQTVQPLARDLGLDVEETEELAEGATPDQMVGLAHGLGPDAAVLCTHGDVIPTFLESLAKVDGLPLPDGYRCAKGSTWVLEPDADGRFVTARYLPAPH